MPETPTPSMPASSAPLFARRLLPRPAMLRGDEIYADLVLPEGPADRPYVVINMVSTVDGKIAVSGRAAGLGSRVDRALMRALRSATDGLMVGAATLRSERVNPGVFDSQVTARLAHGRAAQPLAITVTRDLNVDPGSTFFRNGPARTVVFTTTTASPERAVAVSARAQVERVGSPDVDLGVALQTLRERYNVGTLLVEGGPRLNQALLDGDLVDEIFWTIAPKLAGGSGEGLISGPEPAGALAATLELVSLHECEGELFTRYRVRRPPP